MICWPGPCPTPGSDSSTAATFILPMISFSRPSLRTSTARHRSASAGSSPRPARAARRGLLERGCALFGGQGRKSHCRSPRGRSAERKSPVEPSDCTGLQAIGLVGGWVSGRSRPGCARGLPPPHPGRRTRHRPPDDQQVGAVGERLLGRRDPRLVAAVGPAGRTPGVMSTSRPHLPADGGDLLRRADERPRAGRDGEARQPAHGVAWRPGEPDRVEVGRRQRGEDGDRGDPGLRAARRPRRGPWPARRSRAR